MKTTFLRNSVLNVSFILLSLGSFSQESTNGVPLSWQINGILSTLNTNPHTVQLPSLNNTTLRQVADSISTSNCSECKNNYYGKGIDIAIDVKSQGLMQVLQDGSKLWLLKIASPTALGMQFYFDEFNLPEGAELYIFKEDSTRLLGAFTSINNPKDSTKIIKFGTQIIDGNQIIIEYHEPYNVSFEGKIAINSVTHVFNESGPFSVNGGALPCNVNVSCPEGFGWENEINSVVLILGRNNSNNLSSWCTGALINNTAQDGRPFFLTANHCIDGNIQQNSLYDYSTWTFLFNHQTPNCSSDGSDVSSFTGQSVFGSVVLERDGVGSPTSDYLLLELNAAPSTLASFGACYAGWTLTTQQNSVGPFVGIHHPVGDVKKISIANIINDFSSTHWEIDWDLGTTQGGSSGSPLFNANHRIIGQVHYGKKLPNVDDCDLGKISGYGKFSTSWQNGGFAFWLDPLNTHQTSINTYCPVASGPGGGGGGGGGGSSNACAMPNDRKLANGFFVNGKKDKIIEVCVNTPIIISGIHPDNSCPQLISPNIDAKSKSIFGSCNDIDAFDCHINPIFFSCQCWYSRLFISVTLVNENLIPVGLEFTKWQTFKTPVLVELNGVHYLNPFDLRSYLPSPYIILQSGQTYKIKIANSDFNGWSEYTNYIHIYEDNRTLNGVNITSNVYGKNITISNSTVTQPIEVVASESIVILPNSTLNLGTYRIDEGLNCNSFMRVGVPNNNTYSKGTSKNSSYQYDRDFENTNENFKSTTGDKILIYPNPTSGNFTITQLEKFAGGKIEITNLMGQVIFTTTINSNQLSVNLSEYPKGIYLVKINSDKEQVIEKIVLE